MCSGVYTYPIIFNSNHYKFMLPLRFDENFRILARRLKLNGIVDQIINYAPEFSSGIKDL